MPHRDQVLATNLHARRNARETVSPLDVLTAIKG
ncbi:hypothetical protein IHEIED_00295 [Methylorubrum populi]